MRTIAELDAELNEMIRKGNALDALEKFYAEDCVMIENDQPTRGKAANRKREQEFFGNIDQVHEATIGPSAVGDDVTFCQQSWDVTMKGGQRAKMDEVAVRRWRDGQIVQEQFFYKAG